MLSIPQIPMKNVPVPDILPDLPISQIPVPDISLPDLPVSLPDVSLPDLPVPDVNLSGLPVPPPGSRVYSKVRPCEHCDHRGRHRPRGRCLARDLHTGCPRRADDG